MNFPYGISDFFTLIKEGYFYQDRSDKIPLLEAAGKQLLFIRPRRFGKSLLISMLDNYYDLNRADQFDTLFGKLKIGQDPTIKRNSYLMLKWDFSVIKAQGETTEIEAALHRYINLSIENCAEQYQLDVTIAPDDAIYSFGSLLKSVRTTPHKLYLLIDEYDNFANELMVGREPSRYQALLYGEGLLKTVFKAVKSAASGQGLDRVFITGVSPVVMSDMTSGYNVAKNIYFDSELNDLCGFTEAEVRALVEQVGGEHDLSPARVTQTLETMRTVYNGYSFDHHSSTTIYNPTLSLYFLDHFQKFGSYPDNLLDENMAMDRNKLLYIAKLPHGEEVIVQALDRDGTLTVNQLARRFGVEDMLYGIKDRTFMVSLLYYFGILTLSGVTGFNEKILKIPNLVAKKLYVERLQEQFLPEYEDKEAIRQISRHFCQHGDLEPLCDFIEQRYFKVLSNRDYAFSNELMIKIAFLTLLFNDHLYLIVSETEVDHRYADLSLIVRPDMRRFDALDLLLEFKFLGLKALSLTGEQLRGMSRGELAGLPRVVKKLDEAAEQAKVYGNELSRRYGVPIRCFAVVALGFERLVWREVSGNFRADSQAG